MHVNLLDALQAREGLLCVQGAGGKKTLMRRLALEHPGRVCLTTVVRIPPLRAGIPGLVSVIDERTDVVVRGAVRTRAARVVFAALGSRHRGRYAGLPVDRVGAMHHDGGFDLTVVKADGARMRNLKVADAPPPPLVPGSRVIVIAGAACLGQALDERLVHRPERVAEVVGASRGATLTALHLARALASFDPAPGTRMIGLINQVDGAALLEPAREAATQALRLNPAFSRVVLASLADPGCPVRAVLDAA